MFNVDEEIERIIKEEGDSVVFQITVEDALSVLPAFSQDDQRMFIEKAKEWKSVQEMFFYILEMPNWADDVQFHIENYIEHEISGG